MSDASAAHSDIPPDDPGEFPELQFAKLRAITLPTVPGYRLLRDIKRGGQAAVYQAVNESTGDVVAIKFLRDGPFADEASRTRFEREAAALTTLIHPGIVKTFGSATSSEGFDYIIMEFVAGESLGDYLVRLRDSGQSAAVIRQTHLRIFQEICDAIEAAHARGITHRDLCPSNILIDDHGNPRIIDFGLSTTDIDQMHIPGRRYVSVTGQFYGKPIYASPEQARGMRDHIDARSDVYSLGVILYEMVTGGYYPYDIDAHAGSLDILNQVAQGGSIISPSKRLVRTGSPNPRAGGRRTESATDRALESIILKALRSDPAQRYASGGAFRDDIRNYTVGHPTIATSECGSLRRWVKQRQGSLSIIFLVLCTAIAGVVRVVHRATAPESLPATVSTPTAAFASTSEPSDSRSEAGSAQPRQMSVSVEPVESRTDSDGALPGPVDLLKLVDPERDAVWGNWIKDSDGLICDNAHHMKTIRLPYHPPAEYDLVYDFTVISPIVDNDLNTFCCQGDHNFMMLVGGWVNTRCGLVAVDGRWPDRNPTGLSTPGVLKVGHRQHLVMEIRKYHVRCVVDGKEILSYPTNYQGLNFSGDWAVGCGVLGLGTWDSVRYHGIELIPVSGEGKPIERLDRAQIGKTIFDLPEPRSAISLLDLFPRAHQIGYSGLLRTDIPIGETVSVSGRPCDRFFYAHAPSSIVYDIPPGAIGFTATALATAPNKSIRCCIDIDGNEAVISKTVQDSNNQIDIRLPLPPNARQIELRFVASHYDQAHSVWANPQFLFDTARPEPSITASPTTTLRNNSKEFTNSLGMKFVRLEAGEFMMGSPENEPNRSGNEPLHRVRIDRPFMLATHPVTRAQFGAFVRDTDYKTDAELQGRCDVLLGSRSFARDGVSWRDPGFEQTDQHPVVLVTYHDAIAFADWLTRKEHRRYRLPTEAEWEYACRAGRHDAYIWGNNPDDGAGWLNGRDKDLAVAWKDDGKDIFHFSDGFVYTSPVGSFKPNAWGLYDMLGNVWQWCGDGGDDYRTGLAPDLDGDVNVLNRVFRGGCFCDGPPNERIARRWISPRPNWPHYNVGFRVALDPPIFNSGAAATSTTAKNSL